jgi:hypothetical protein
MQTAYELFRHLHLEWALYAGILSLGLGRFFSEEAPGRREILFVPGCILTCALAMPLVNLLPFRPVFSSQGSAIRALYLLFFVIMLVWTALCYPGRVRNGTAYTIYYVLFIILCLCGIFSGRSCSARSRSAISQRSASSFFIALSSIYHYDQSFLLL